MELYGALLAASPEELLTPLVASSDGRLVDAAREDVVYRPGREVLLRFAVHVERGGTLALEGWVLHAGAAGPTGTHVLDGPFGQVGAWRVRDDPSLPGLRAALDRPAVVGLLQALGLPDEGLVLSLLAYRPRRRAVVRAQTATHELYLKCVPPERAPALHRRHVACSAGGLPVPRAVGYDAPQGLLVLTPLHGTSLRSALLAEDGTLPAPQQVVALMQSFGDVQLDETARSPVQQARGHAQLLRALVPSEADRIDHVLGEVRAVPDGEVRVVHGDFYDAQVLVHAGAVAGVVDVDGAGQGHAADDAANLLAHLLLLRELVPTAALLQAWLPAAVDEVRAVHDPDQLRRRTAAVLLGLATWPHSQHASGWEARTVRILGLAQEALRAPG